MARFLGVFNLAKSGTIEADALLNLKFEGVKSSRGFNPLKHTGDERRKNLERSINGLRQVINFSDYVLPLNADISRLEFQQFKNLKSEIINLHKPQHTQHSVHRENPRAKLSACSTHIVLR